MKNYEEYFEKLRECFKKQRKEKMFLTSDEICDCFGLMSYYFFDGKQIYLKDEVDKVILGHTIMKRQLKNDNERMKAEWLRLESGFGKIGEKKKNWASFIFQGNITKTIMVDSREKWEDIKFLYRDSSCDLSKTVRMYNINDNEKEIPYFNFTISCLDKTETLADFFKEHNMEI